MWAEIGKMIRKAMDGWSALGRFVICVLVLTAAAAVLMWASAL
jgi:hypothetical protein